MDKQRNTRDIEHIQFVIWPKDIADNWMQLASNSQNGQILKDI